MKHLILSLLFALVVCNSFAQTPYTIEGNNIVVVVNDNKTSIPPTKTSYTYTIKGDKYPVYKSSRGAYFILRTSKNGKEYKQYLPKDVQAELKKRGV